MNTDVKMTPHERYGFLKITVKNSLKDTNYGLTAKKTHESK